MIDPKFWDDADFEEIDNFDTLGLYLYLMSNTDADSTGAYRLNKRTAMTRTRLTQERLETALAELLKMGPEPKIMYDPETKWIWVKALFGRTYKVVPNQNIAKNVWGLVERLQNSDCPFKEAFIERYEGLLNGFANTLGIGPNTRTDPKEKENEKREIETKKGTEKKGCRYPDEFEAFWVGYPRKVDKCAAFKAWNRAIKRLKSDEAWRIISDGIEGYARHCCLDKVEQRHIKHATTWLNNDCWENDYKTESKKGKYD